MHHHPERANYLFRIADDVRLAQIPADGSLPDDVYDYFCARYREWMPQRNAAVKRYLDENPREFRTYVPFTERTFQITNEVFWYYDEIVSSDPLASCAEDLDGPAREQSKVALLHNFQLLLALRPLIDAGLLLFAETPISQRDLGETPPHFSELAADPEVRTAFDNELRFGMDRLTLSNGAKVTRIDVRLEATMNVICNFEVPPGGTTIPILTGGVFLPPISRGEIPPDLLKAAMESVQQSYVHEVALVNRRLMLANQLRAGVLFDRRSNALVANRLGRSVSSRPVDPSAGLSLALPYIAGASAPALMESRTDLPESFVNFRRRLMDVVALAAASERADDLDVAAAVEREITPHLGSLSAEMRAAAIRARIIGYGVPAVFATGSLVAGFLGAPPSAAAAAAASGLLPAVTATADYAHRSRTLQSNPFYFLWRARRVSQENN